VWFIAEHLVDSGRSSGIAISHDEQNGMTTHESVGKPAIGIGVLSLVVLSVAGAHRTPTERASAAAESIR
jgi:hypothetical protein